MLNMDNDEPVDPAVDLRSEHRSLGSFNIFNQYNLALLVRHMGRHAKLMMRCVNEKEIQHMLYSSKLEFTQHVFYLTLSYLRGIRAFHLKNRILEKELYAADDARIQKIKDKINETLKKDREEGGAQPPSEGDNPDDEWQYNILTVEHLCGHFQEFFSFILSHGYVKQLIELKKSARLMIDKLIDKGKRDQELQNSKVYKISVERIKQCVRDFVEQASVKEDLMNERVLTNVANQQSIQKMYKQLMTDQLMRKSFSSTLHSVFEYNHVDLANEGDFL